MYAALIPQFINTTAGSTFEQFIQLGMVQLVIAITINGAISLRQHQSAQSYQKIHLQCVFKDGYRELFLVFSQLAC